VSADKTATAGFKVELAGAAVTASSLLALEDPPVFGAAAGAANDTVAAIAPGISPAEADCGDA
jgi:hypothetical protein